jgi:hypothetical protein
LDTPPIHSISKIEGKYCPFTDIFLQWKVYLLEDTAEEAVVNDAAAQLAECLAGMEM